MSRTESPSVIEAFLMNERNYDVLIIGGGVTGCAIARELSKYQCKVLLVEKEEDVCSGTSKANSAIVHAGYDAKPGSFKAKLNARILVCIIIQKNFQIPNDF